MRWTTRLVILALALIGGGLLLQPDRFQRTPSYGALLNVFHATTWGAIYLAVAAGVASWAFRRACRAWIWWGAAVHTAAVMLLGGWLMAFVVRWATDDATTIVNVVSWSMFLILAVQSSATVYDGPRS